MTSEEKIMALHERMDKMRRARERRTTRVVGSAGIILAVCLVLLIIRGGSAHIGGMTELYSGAIMLFEGVGGYVLIAAAAFMAGVVLTAVLIRKKKNDDKRDDKTKISGREE